jgi:rhodanese-related sulfurtransferase
MAAQKLTDLGFTNVRAYEGGLEDWKNAGHSIETAAA